MIYFHFRISRLIPQIRHYFLFLKILTKLKKEYCFYSKYSRLSCNSSLFICPRIKKDWQFTISFLALHIIRYAHWLVFFAWRCRGMSLLPLCSQFHILQDVTKTLQWETVIYRIRWCPPNDLRHGAVYPYCANTVDTYQHVTCKHSRSCPDFGFLHFTQARLRIRHVKSGKIDEI